MLVSSSSGSVHLRLDGDLYLYFGKGFVDHGKKISLVDRERDIVQDGSSVIGKIEILNFNNWLFHSVSLPSALFKYIKRTNDQWPYLRASANTAETRRRFSAQSGARGSAAYTFPPMARAMVSALFLENCGCTKRTLIDFFLACSMRWWSCDGLGSFPSISTGT